MDKSTAKKNISVLDRILLLITGLLAAYQVGFGIERVEAIPQIFFTIAFGVVLVAGLLIIILGFEILDNPFVLIVSTIIPLSLAGGLIAWWSAAWIIPYLGFAIGVFALIIFTRFSGSNSIKVFSVILGHSVAGLEIVFLPIYTIIIGTTSPVFSLVSLGGVLMGLGGVLMAFLKIGKPILSNKVILSLLPGLLMMMVCFVIGFSGFTV